MNVSVHVPRNLLAISRGEEVVPVQGETVGDCLAALVERFPRMKEELFFVRSDDSASMGLRSHVRVRKNRTAVGGDVLRTPVAEGDHVDFKLNLQ